MKLALLLPSYWPEVKRGSERVVHDIATQLAQRGHEVTVITSHSGRGTETVEEGVLVARVRRPPRVPQLRWYEDHIDRAVPMTLRLLRGRYDLAHAFHPSIGFTTAKTHRYGAPPLVFSIHGIPIRRFLVERRYRLEMLRTTVDAAAANTVLSEAAAVAFRRYLLRDPVVMPAGFFPEAFRVEAEKSAVPTIVCAASLDDERKRGELLFRAFARLRQARRDVRLVLLPPPGSLVAGQDLPEGAEVIENASTGDLALAYTSAWVSVLAAVEEAQGLVMVESHACGTPVVAARSGAGPEIVRSDAVGRLFQPDDEADLVRALDEALDLRAQPETDGACRENAKRFEWDRLIDQCERLYEQVKENDR